ncbi:MAG TPA: 3-oxoacyl-[acyl-carrier-protein] reductase [bacterium]
MAKNIELTGKIAVVTGGSRGIGSAVALNLASGGAAVIVNYLTNEKKALQVVNELKSSGGTGEAVRFDVSSENDVKNAFDGILDKYGRIDILVNNAGTTMDNLLVRMKSEEWLKVIHTNLNGVFFCTRAVLRTMLKQRSGSIVNLTSVVGITGNRGQANYCAAKAGVIGFTKSVAREVASRGIRVNAVAPGFIETDMTSSLSEEKRNEIKRAIPVEKLGTPGEVADVVFFLCSDLSSYITGQVIGVNGGMLM